MTKRVALYPGTFDPMTLGHLDIMKRASNLCDKLVIGVAINRSKGPLFALDERVEMVEHVVAPFRERIEVDVKPFEGLLIHFVESVALKPGYRDSFFNGRPTVSNYCIAFGQRNRASWRGCLAICDAGS